MDIGDEEEYANYSHRLMWVCLALALFVVICICGWNVKKLKHFKNN